MCLKKLNIKQEEKQYVSISHRIIQKNRKTDCHHIKEKAFIKALAQKAYDQKILHSAQRELSLLLRLQKRDSEFSIEEIYSHLSIHRQKLVTPIDLPDEEYIRLWKSQPFTPKGFDESSPEHYTSRGNACGQNQKFS